jgi:serine protease
MATPIVAATAALVLARQPTLTPAEVKGVLQRSARAFPQSGADNGPDDPTPVVACTAPTNADQLQCYCSTSLCGAGMLDAAGAVGEAEAGPFARIAVTPSAPVAGSTVQLSGAATLLGTGRTVASWTWTLVDGGGAVSALSGSNQASTASLLPTAADTVTVRLTVVDDSGRSASAESIFTVAAAPVVTPGNGSSSGGGGGLATPLWFAGLLAAAVALCRLRRGAGRQV